MPFISSKYFEKEQTNHNVYDETGMNEICGIATCFNQLSTLVWSL